MAYYVCSDLHGYSLRRFLAFLRQVGFGKDDRLYILGDVIDRGADGFRILKWMMGQPNVKLLLGNHEAMMLDCDFLFQKGAEDDLPVMTGQQKDALALWMANGGQATLDALTAVRGSEIRYVLDYVRKAPLWQTITAAGREFVLTHAGLDNFRADRALSDYTQDELVWTRPEIDRTFFADRTVVFGHTPTFFYGKAYEGKAIFTSTWINIDVGAGYGLPPMLLRLDDLQTFYMKPFPRRLRRR